MKVKCRRCGYEWDTKSGMSFVTCPSCGYKTPKTGRVRAAPAPRRLGITKRGVEKVTSWTKWAVPLVTAIVVVAVGAWAASVYLGGEEEVSEVATVSVSPGVVFGAAPTKSGIENIYIVEPGTATDVDLSGSGNVIATIESSGGSVTIPAGTTFDIVIAYKAHGDNLYAISLDNAKILWEVSGAYLVSAGTEITDENIFENTAPVGTVVIGTDNYMRVNARGASGWTLNAGQSISLDNVSLYIWGQ